MDIVALTGELAEELDLAKAASKDALAGLPSRSATALATAENQAVEKAKAAARTEVNRVQALHDGAKNALANCETALAEARQRRISITHQNLNDDVSVGNAKRDADAAGAAYNHFKLENHLMREPTDDDRVAQGVWAATLVLAESVFNSYFYMPISDLGLIGGFFIAFFVSFVNVSVAFVGGVLGLRYLSHVSISKQLGGVLTTLITTLGCLVVVAMSALFRGHVDALGAADLDATDILDRAWRLALASLVTFDLQALFASLNSFLLTFVGLLCALVGFWKGAVFDDPYPGFGTAARKREHAEETHQQRRSEWRETRRNALASADQKLVEHTAKLNAEYQGFLTAVQDAKSLATQTAELARGLLGVYRKKNALTRADAPPTYFGQFPPAMQFSSLDDLMTDLTVALDSLRCAVEQRVADCQQEQRNISHALAHIDVGN